MNNKFSMILIAIAVILIVAGGYLIFTNQSGGDVTESSSDIPLKTQNFKLFEINTPEGSNFTIKNEANGMKFYQNNGSYSENLSGIIINKGLTDSLIGDKSFTISNSSSQQIYSSDFKNRTVYKYVSNQGDVDVILMGNDLNLLKEVSQTIKIKDVSNL
ncbi:MAG: hypothetical protein IKF13_03450 [Methanobrevibacter sp.]|uniref:hypothetical protein n=1 Tax=Methanobrevibacter sp. UBA212 TaxID=1915476 RepID=UPI0025FBD149|nr:hypothetical protein [Methanobrevibacter sp. UBA212]MBR3155854.1 hypothetical protein [Methanobrevibacter sp.]